MIKKISYILFLFLSAIDYLFKLLNEKGILIYFYDFNNTRLYKNIVLLNKKLIFFCPNSIVYWRVETLLTKEPETIDWINNFKNKQNIIFWDIGSNIGLYSIYNSIKNNKTKTIAFEPSTSNLRVLSRNIFINNLDKKIKIFPVALTNKENKFLYMKEEQFYEGSALNVFGENYNYQGKKFKKKMQYSTFGTSINYLLKNNILEIPNYIKIDVDGIEHLILSGAEFFLSNKKIISLNIEINENFNEQQKNILKIMKKNNFKIDKKFRSQVLEKNSKFDKTFNYIFIR